MTTLTVSKDRLFLDLEPGDRITAVDGHDLRRVQVVDSPRVRTFPGGPDAVALVNPLGTETEWRLYPGNVEVVTVERDEPTIPETSGGTAVDSDQTNRSVQAARAAARVVVRRTRYGLRLQVTETPGVYGCPPSRSWWTTEDGVYAIGRVRGVSFCDGPHPMRWRDQDGILRTGYCEGDQEHDSEVGWDIRPTPPGLHADMYDSLDDAWEDLAQALLGDSGR